MSILEIKSSDARMNFRDLLDSVMTGDNDIMILRNGKQIAAIIPAEDYVEIREELEDLRLSRIADDSYNEYLADKEAARSYNEFSADLIGAGEEHA
jgi:prevent-host-death family protein